MQNYADLDSTLAARDPGCGPLTYDGHKGTDFRVLSRAAFRAGVTVRAAASGTVVGVRNTMPDASPGGPETRLVRGRECGNGLLIDHGGGWVTQYCHMRRGSVRPNKGDGVAAGDALGLVGMSGQTQFPHLHFEVRRDGTPLDPFTGRAASDAGCGAGADASSLWRDAGRDNLAYVSAGLIDSGFSERAPSMVDIDRRTADETQIAASAAALVFWVRAFGILPTDRQRLHIIGPDGTSLFDQLAEPVNRPKAQWLSFGGRRSPPHGWPQGVYRGRYMLIRDGVVIVESERSVRVVP